LQLQAQFVGCVDEGRTCTLDSFSRRLVEPCFVKIDVEGQEAEVLEGARGLLSADARWLIETHSSSAERRCLEILRDAGFEAHVIPNAWWRRIVPEGRNLPHNRWIGASRMRFER
jgi:Methyltransferase FkbM domain